MSCNLEQRVWDREELEFPKYIEDLIPVGSGFISSPPQVQLFRYGTDEKQEEGVRIFSPISLNF